MLNKQQGLFITFEGIDGAGKSTHSKWLVDYLKSKNIAVANTREPGGTPLGEKIRTLVLNDDMHIKTEVLLMFAARNEHIQTFIKPNLNKGIWVISDRFTDASYAYQGAGRGLEIEKIAILENLVCADFEPDCTFLFDLPLSVAKQRLSKSRKLDRFELEEQDFFLRIKNAYLDRAKKYSHRFLVLDSSKSIDATNELIKDKIDQLIQSINKY